MNVPSKRGHLLDQDPVYESDCDQDQNVNNFAPCKRGTGTQVS